MLPPESVPVEQKPVVKEPSPAKEKIPARKVAEVKSPPAAARPARPMTVYQADEGHVVTARWLAGLLALVVLFSLAPVAAKMHFDLETAPGWARVVVLIAGLQFAYLAWMANRPDWSSLWVVMIVFAGVSTLYGAAMAVAFATLPHEPILLGMEGVRQSAGSWCGAILLVMALATYLAGRMAVRWHRSAELESQ